MITGYGYEGFLIDDFMEKLENEDVQILFDVRRVPVSRKPGFNKVALRKKCVEYNIIYRHLPALGISSADRSGIEVGTVRRQVLETYRVKINSNRDADMKRELQQIVDAELEGLVIGIMCLEKDICTCHRQFVIERAKALSLRKRESELMESIEAERIEKIFGKNN